jgi:hypothetical protein
MTLKEHIAKTLMHSRVGMTRKELASAIDVTIYENNIDRISDQLFRLKKSSHVEGSFTNGRWSITAQGRAYYSDLNDDETDNQTQPSTEQLRPVLQPASLDLVNREGTKQHSTEILEAQHENPIDDNNTQPEQMENIPHELAQTENDQQLQTDEISHTPITYDPFGDIYNQLQQAQHMLQNLKLPESPRIKNKDAKIKLLTMFKDFHGIFNEDVDAVLSNIIHDLEQLEAA